MWIRSLTTLKITHQNTLRSLAADFIGLEMVENLRNRGLDVTLVEATPQGYAESGLRNGNIPTRTFSTKRYRCTSEYQIEAFSNAGHTLTFAGGDSINTDLVILCHWYQTKFTVSKRCGVKTNDRGFITVNDHFETNLPDIYAIGDVITVQNAITNQTVSIPLAGPANRQGRYLADDLAGIDRQNPAVFLGRFVAKVFALTTASTGVNERQLKAPNMPYEVVHLHPNSSAGYTLRCPYRTESPLSHLKAISSAHKLWDQRRCWRIDIISTAIVSTQSR